jgi:hypothetical protein
MQKIPPTRHYISTEMLSVVTSQKAIIGDPPLLLSQNLRMYEPLIRKLKVIFLNMVPLNYVNGIETASYFKRKSCEISTVLNFKDYFVSV